METSEKVSKNNLMDEKGRLFASRVSLVVGIFLLIVKFYGYQRTSSQAMLSDALESIVNVVAASLVLFVIRFSNKPKDENHPYGHGKIEYFSAAFEGGLVTFAAVMIIIAAISSLFTGKTLYNLQEGVAIIFAAGLGNLFLGIYLHRVGVKTNSQALQASGTHVISDFWTSLGVGLGLLVVYLTGIHWLDSLIAIAAGVMLSFSGVKLVRKSIKNLMDGEDLELIVGLEKAISKLNVQGAIQVHHLRVIRSGWFHHIDAHIVLPEFWDVSRAHTFCYDFEKKLFENYNFEGEANFHFDPCRRAYCKHCDIDLCAVRKENFIEKLPINIKDLTCFEEPGEFK